LVFFLGFFVYFVWKELLKGIQLAWLGMVYRFIT
jgi:hypothetical protein